MRTSNRNLAGAFTLVEALLAATVLAMAITAILLPFTAGARSQLVEARQTLAASLAQQLLEEILLRPFEEPDDGDEDPEAPGDFGPDIGESTRDDFSAIDDYDGYTEAEGTVTGADGQVLDAAAAVGLSRHVAVAYVYVAGQDVDDDPTFLRVIVEIKHRGDPVIRLTRLIHWVDN